MKKFIELTYADETKTYVNFDHVVAYEVSIEDSNFTRVLTSFIGISVKETPRQINYLLHE